MYLLQIAVETKDFKLTGNTVFEIVILLVVITAIFFGIKYLPKIIEKISEFSAKKIVDEKNALAEENNALIKTVSTTIKKLQEYIEGFRSELLVFRAEVDEMKSMLAENESYMDSISQGTLVQMLADETMAAKHRARAFLRLLALGVNGRVKKNGMIFVLNHKESWLDALEDIKYLNLKIKEQQYFDSVIKEIEKRIMDMGLVK